METTGDRDDLTAARRVPADGLRAGLDAVLAAVRSPALSFDRLRGAVVRFGSLARDQDVPLDDTLSALARSVGDASGALPGGQRAEVLAFVQWWALHGYHRAD